MSSLEGWSLACQEQKVEGLWAGDNTAPKQVWVKQRVRLKRRKTSQVDQASHCFPPSILSVLATGIRCGPLHCLLGPNVVESIWRLTLAVA